MCSVLTSETPSPSSLKHLDISQLRLMVDPGQPATNGDAPRARRGGGRPCVAIKKQRPPRGSVRRALPSFVDMGTLTQKHNVRYDAGTDRLDLADLLIAGYDSWYAAQRVLGELSQMGAFDHKPAALAKLKLAASDIGKGKWADEESNRGRARHMVSRKGAAAMVHSTSARAPHALRQMAAWLADALTDPVTLLPATPHSTDACCNVHDGK